MRVLVCARVCVSVCGLAFVHVRVSVCVGSRACVRASVRVRVLCV